MSLEVEIDAAGATYAATPEYGQRVVFEVRWRVVRHGPPRFVVQLKNSSGDGFSQHLKFETACRAALSRARRYDRAFSKPRSRAA